ncbi:hypothetical protein CL622_06190 [archaeon]|nr:hypothetical protein [archaeon]|tara:strand:+ start:1126 stop:1764 length:639 start_codon:yes stop_codon:yes gene_type:complete
MKIIQRVIKRFQPYGYLPKRYSQLYKIVNRVMPINIIEIGTWNGDNAIRMIKIAKKYHPKKSINYFGFDLFENLSQKKLKDEMSLRPLHKKEFYEKLGKTGVNVQLFQGDTILTLPEALKNLPVPDLVFIDGGHSLKTVASDWKNIKNIISSQTAVIFDDYWVNQTSAGCKPLIDSIDRVIYEVDILPIFDIHDSQRLGKRVTHMVEVRVKK